MSFPFTFRLLYLKHSSCLTVYASLWHWHYQKNLHDQYQLGLINRKLTAKHVGKTHGWCYHFNIITNICRKHNINKKIVHSFTHPVFLFFIQEPQCNGKPSSYIFWYCGGFHHGIRKHNKIYCLEKKVNNGKRRTEVLDVGTLFSKSGKPVSFVQQMNGLKPDTYFFVKLRPQVYTGSQQQG